MKKLITICLLLAIPLSVNAQAQNTPLNKQQTLDYIEKLFKATYRYEDDKVLSVTLDEKTLNISITGGNVFRRDLTRLESLTIDLVAPGYNVSYPSDKLEILFAIQIEADAKKLKKALEHLIEILKTEKSKDPFGE